MTQRTVRWGGIAAIGFVVLLLIPIVSGGAPPAADAAADKIRTYLVDHRSALLVNEILRLVGVPLVIWFFVVFREIVRGDRTANALGTASLAGVLVTAPMAMAAGAITTAAIYVDGMADKLNDDTVRIVYETQRLLLASTAAGIVLLSLTAALAIRRTGALPPYTMWVALLAVVGNVAGMVSIVGAGAANLGLAGVLTFAVFIVVTGVTITLGNAPPQSAGAA